MDGRKFSIATFMVRTEREVIVAVLVAGSKAKTVLGDNHLLLFNCNFLERLHTSR